MIVYSAVPKRGIIKSYDSGRGTTNEVKGMRDLRFSFRALVSLSIMIAAALTCQGAETPEELDSDPIEIEEIFDEISAFEGERVVIEGKIVNECPAGCFFVVQDDTGSIFVDIFPSNFVIPQKVGKIAQVYGKVSTRDGDPYIIGEIVKVDGEVYR